ncbi:MAG: hypothetical protein HGA55_02320 [Methanoregulaceae archaeon]|nr:hypothetical protein [Methanoregulaceae archaeon]
MGEQSGGTAPGEGDHEAEILAHIRMIEIQYQSRIVNREDIARRILSRTRDPVCILSIALSLNNWVAVTGRTGDIDVPVAIIDRITDNALKRRGG